MYKRQTIRNAWIFDDNNVFTVPKTGRYLITFKIYVFGDGTGQTGTTYSRDGHGFTELVNFTTGNTITSFLSAKINFTNGSSSASSAIVPIAETRTVAADLIAGQVLKFRHRLNKYDTALPPLSTDWFAYFQFFSMQRLGD